MAAMPKQLRGYAHTLIYTLILGLLLSCSPDALNTTDPATDLGGVVVCSETFSLTATNGNNNLAAIITAGTIPNNLSGYDQASQEIFSHYPAGATVTAQYVKEGGTGDGSSYSNAAGSVKTVLDGITNAGPNRVYAILIAPGTYDAGQNIAMKNHVAIVGGEQCSEGFSGPPPVILSGGGTHRVFNNSDITNTAVLYGVTIAKGTAEKGGGMYNTNASPTLTEVTFSRNTAGWGGGMYNDSSSPTLTGVTFSGNTAALYGGGMFNYSNKESSSLVLNNITFSGNKANDSGGGMYNDNSSPVLNVGKFSDNTARHGGGIYNYSNKKLLLTNVTFSSNKATRDGGGMYNYRSSPMVAGVTLSGNTATENGGGIYNTGSSPILIGGTLSGNKATKNGGGIYNDNDDKNPFLINTILWGNTAGLGGSEIFFWNDSSSGVEKLFLYNSIVKGGLPEGYASGTSTNSFNGGGFTSGGGTASIVVSFSSLITVDPGLLPLADNGGGLLTHAIPATSSAVNQGFYVKWDFNNLYLSGNGSNWYRDPELSDITTPPADALTLTATDATGYERVDRPDLGAYEAR